MVVLQLESDFNERTFQGGWNIYWVDEVIIFVVYCAISINLAGPMMCDGPAEILVLATSQNSCNMPKFLGV